MALTRHPNKSRHVIAAGETFALDMSRFDFGGGIGMGWMLKTAAGGTATHRASNAPRPAADDWLEPPNNAAIAAAQDVLVKEDTPVGWLRWTAAGQPAVLALAGYFEGLADAHHSSADHDLTAYGSMPDIADLRVGSKRSVEVDAYFHYAHPSDAAAGALSFAASSADSGDVQVSMSGSTLTLTGAGVAADTTITVTATAPHGGTAQQSFDVTTLANRDPVSSGPAGQTKSVTVGKSLGIHVGGYFRDPDEGQTLTYSAVSDTVANVTVAVSGETVTITGVAAGTSQITVTATDPAGATATWVFTASAKPSLSNHAVQTHPIHDFAYFREESYALNVDVRNYFSPGSANRLVVHDVVSSQPATISAELRSDGHTIHSERLRDETAKVTVTFTVGTDEADTPADRAHGSFNVLVGDWNHNLAPRVSQTIPPGITLHSSSARYTIDLASYFTDPNDDALDYTGTVSGPAGEFTLSISGSNATVQYVGPGLPAGGSVTCRILWKATDGGGLSVSQSQTLTWRSG